MDKIRFLQIDLESVTVPQDCAAQVDGLILSTTVAVSATSKHSQGALDVLGYRRVFCVGSPGDMLSNVGAEHFHDRPVVILGVVGDPLKSVICRSKTTAP